VTVARITRKSYAVAREADRTFVINVREDLFPATVISGFVTMDEALDECARVSAQEDERRRRELTPLCLGSSKVSPLCGVIPWHFSSSAPWLVGVSLSSSEQIGESLPILCGRDALRPADTEAVRDRVAFDWRR
jgi:hypothetical protein